MKQFFSAAIICIIALSACTAPFKKAKDGTNYKVISNNSGARIENGNIMELENLVKYKDSVLKNTRDEGMPIFAGYDTATYPSPYKEIFKTVHVGDSIVVRTSTDSLIAKRQAPPFMLKGQYLYQYFKITNVYKTKEAADSAQKLRIADIQKKDSLFALEQIVKDNKAIDAYLAKNNVTATKGEKGTYVQILNPGTGNTADTSKVLMVNYTGKSFDGVAFDSNTDTAFHHVDPYPISLSQPQVIPGWIDGLKMLKKGAKAKFYIPSSLGYGKRGSGAKIKPNENLIFDIEVVDMISQADYMQMMQKKQQQQMAQQQMMQQMQKQMQQQQQGKQQNQQQQPQQPRVQGGNGQ